MAVFTVPNVRICGLSACVSKNTEDNMALKLLSDAERVSFVNTVGIRYRRVVENGITASDLCYAAAEKLLTELNWNRNDIKLLVFISQTPDYIIPNTASVLHEKLALAKDCIAFDINLGCSGYVYGLSVLGSLLQNMHGAKALLLVGDVSTKTISPKDKSTVSLFSDAGTATALMNDDNNFMHFNLQTDGSEYDDIMIPDGGFRNPVNSRSFEEKEYAKGVVRNNIQMKLDGVKIFNFSLREIAPNILSLMTEKGIEQSSIDFFVMHQANLLMLESVRKKLKIEADKVPYSLYDYGNTSSASVPVTMVTKLREVLQQKTVKLLLSGFGVGLSWGSVYLETQNITCCELIEV